MCNLQRICCSEQRCLGFFGGVGAGFVFSRKMCASVQMKGGEWKRDGERELAQLTACDSDTFLVWEAAWIPALLCPIRYALPVLSQ